MTDLIGVKIFLKVVALSNPYNLTTDGYYHSVTTMQCGFWNAFNWREITNLNDLFFSITTKMFRCFRNLFRYRYVE